jgi:transposase
MQRRRFSREFKIEAVKLVRERGVSVAQAGRDLGVHENVLRKWVKEFGSDPVQAFPGHGQMKPEQLEIERLRREVNKLKAERDILKKAAVGSIGERNALRKLSARCDEAKCFSRPCVEFQRHGVEIGLTVNR